MDFLCGWQRCLPKAPSMVALACLVILGSSLTESQSTITFRSHPSSQTVKTGSHVTLDCSAQYSNRKITYEWEHNNSTIQTDLDARLTITRGGSLQISQTSFEDRGTYQCIASAKKGKVVGRSNVATLNVEGMCSEAKILTRPASSTRFPEGNNIWLRCKCRSSSLGVVRWIKDGVNVRPRNGRISMDRRKLYINGTTVGDSGNYTCYLTIDNLGTTKSQKLQIWVGNSPRIRVHPPDNVKVVKGQKVFLTCAATGNPAPGIYWHYIGPIWYQHVKHSITNDSKYKVYNNGTLVIKNVGSSDTGRYECEARNIMGSTSKKFRLYLPVIFLTRPKNRTVVFGRSMWFHCNATGTPKPAISWEKEGGTMDNTRFRQYPSGALFVKSVRLTDAGRYSCIAANTEDLQETTFTLTVTESHVIRLSQSHKYSIAAFLGSLRRITCEFHGSPPITVKWTKEGVDKLPSRVEARGNTLIIKSVELGDAGKYICNGSNSFSSHKSYVNLSIYVPMKFVLTPRNKTVLVGDSVWFHCAASGSPKPKVTWLKYKQGGNRLDPNKYKTYENGSLNIRNVQLADRGRYFCMAATKTDLKQMTVTLGVKEKHGTLQRPLPSPPCKNSRRIQWFKLPAFT